MKIKILSYILGCFIFSSLSIAGESSIPLNKDARSPSDDLIFSGKVLTSLEAKNLKGVDLSSLNPNLNEIYNNQNNLKDDDSDLLINESETLSFQGSLLSNSGLLRFNVLSNSDGNIYTIHLDKNLHTMLLRKNLLRRLGYVIPTMKFLKNVSISFNSEAEKKEFISRTIPENTLGAAERWLVKDNGISIELQDVVVTEPNERDFYNVAMGVPTETINSRTLRSLVVFYNLLDLGESVNQFSWITGKIDNQLLQLTHFTNNEFNSTIDDIFWGLKKINRLNRDDFKQIINLSHFPAGVSDVLLEKIISRRNSLNKLLNLNEAPIDFNSKINVDQSVKEGRIVQSNFPGYAARFSYGDAETPFDQIRYYLFSKLQSNIIDNAINFMNTKAITYDLNQKRSDYFTKQFQDGLQHFIQTGELQPIGIGTWTSPVLNGNLILSRDIVLGNYLGTDNMVQLADTIGAGINLGEMVGIEGIGNNLSSTVSATISLVRTYTHLKPVKSLKSSLKEPFRNMFVNLLRKNLKNDYLSLSELKNYKPENGKTDERSKKIQDFFKDIDLNLGTGESLIMTDRIMPSASLNLNFSQGIVGAGIGINGSVAVVKRIHLYKKAPQILQIFDDYGHTRTIDLSFKINASGFSIIKLSQTFDSGKYNIKSYLVNLNGDVDQNPNLFTNANGVYEVLKSKNFEVLDANLTPVKVDATYSDRSTSFSFLLWKIKKLKGTTWFDVKAKDGVNGKYFSFQKDFLTGTNVESMTKQIANYYIEQKDPNISITDEQNKNPGETFLGSGRTETIRFESSIDDAGKFSKKFLTISDMKEGWSMSENSLRKFIDKVNSKFNFNLFDTTQVDFKNLKLYRVGYHLNLYEKAIERLGLISENDINAIESKYKEKANCNPDSRNNNAKLCGDLSLLKYKLNRCRKNLNDSELGICQTEFLDELYSDLDFEDFKTLLGGTNNFYLYGSIDGFRKGSEVLNDTIYSNSIGRIGSQFWNGPFEAVRSLVGVSDGEFSAGWLRMGL